VSIHLRALTLSSSDAECCRIESQISVRPGGVHVEERRRLGLHVGNLNADRESLAEAGFEHKRECGDVIAEIHHRVAKRGEPGRISGELLKSCLEAGEIGELPHPNRVEREIDTERLQSAIRAARGVLAEALVEPGPLSQSAEAKHASRKHQRIVTNTEHALRGGGVGENRDDCQCQSGNADQRTTHRLSAGCEGATGAFV